MNCFVDSQRLRNNGSVNRPPPGVGNAHRICLVDSCMEGVWSSFVKSQTLSRNLETWDTSGLTPAPSAGVAFAAAMEAPAPFTPAHPLQRSTAFERSPLPSLSPL